MTNEELVILIKGGADVADNMLQLWNQTKAFIYSAARRYRGYAEVEDLVQEGYLALYDAVDGYDQQQSCSFLTYAAFHIQLKMRRYIFGNCGMHIPEGLQEKIRKYENAVQTYKQQNGREPDRLEIAECMGVSEEQLEKILSVREKYKIGSLDAAAGENGEDTIGSLISSGEDMTERIIEEEQNRQLKNILWPMVDALEERQAQIIRIRYQNNLTKPQIGELLGIDKQEVANIEKKALTRLRQPRNISKLKPFLPEYEEAIAYRSCGVSLFNRTWTSSTERAAIELY